MTDSIQAQLGSKAIQATFVSLWDEGKVETECKINLDTLEVFDIEASDDSEGMMHLLEETVEVEVNGRFEFYTVNEVNDKYFIGERDKPRLLAQLEKPE